MTDTARHVRIYGRVQGVFFRAWTSEQADELGVRGWVRNCPDGRVEAHVEGDERAVETLIDRMRHGPRSAKVDDLRTWDADVCDFEGFDVRH